MRGRWKRISEILGFVVKYRDDWASPRGPDRAKARQGRGEEFKRDLVALGPAFIKIGQFLSTHPRLVPEEWTATLESLQDDVGAFPFDDVRATIESDLGVRLTKVFASFGEEPVGCASLAQVHRAVLRDGREVAVKVQRPGIADDIRQDMRALRAIARLAESRTDVGTRVRLVEAVDDMERTLRAELDFMLEAENLERVGGRIRSYPELVVPMPHWALTGRRVLTMDLVHGVKVTGLGLQRTEHDLDRVAQSLIRAYLDQAFVHGEIHADPHPGNVRLTSDGRLAIFDFGMLAFIPPQQRMQLLKLLLASVEGRSEDVVREALSLGTRTEGFDRERYEREVGQLVSHYAAHRDRRALSEGELVLELSRISAEHRVRLPAELNLLGKALFNVEHICECLQPDVDVKAVVEEHLESIISGRLRRALSPANLATDLLEMERLLHGLPRKLADTLSLVSENRLQVRITGLQDSLLMENMQKIANRVSTGLIVAALLIASALVLRVETPHRLFGYPTLALVMLLVAALLGLAIVVSAWSRDRRAKPRNDRGPG